MTASKAIKESHVARKARKMAELELFIETHGPVTAVEMTAGTGIGRGALDNYLPILLAEGAIHRSRPYSNRVGAQWSIGLSDEPIEEVVAASIKTTWIPHNKRDWLQEAFFGAAA